MVEYYLRQLDETASNKVEALFVHVFEQAPWHDDWSDKTQLKCYIHDLMGQNNSLTFGLYEGKELVGLSMGRVKHWYTGTEYCIDELCICTEKQSQGLGALFIREIEQACKAQGFTHLFLLTENDVPAYEFYKKQGFYELETNVAFAKKL
ncbi:MAG: GNAT family N-acetyltransferase [Oscillospiraceae bacterium]|jgi:aminoglycoside 6'-N-acetyltransferase I|nr:GNAT family N-acetyltransferase [Oscillospiraceae bacterium]